MRKAPLAAALLLSSCLLGYSAAANAAVFTDIGPDHWAYDEISYLASAGLLQGYEDGGFHPQLLATRAEAATLLVRAKKLELLNKGAALPFSDVPSGYWANSDIAIAYQHHLIDGYPDGTFHPEHPVTRAELAAMLVRLFHFENGKVGTVFSDVSSRYWAFDDISILSGSGIAEGDDSRRFQPDRAVTRAELSALLARSLNPALRQPLSASAPAGDVYELELARWGIHNDNSHPQETTDGMNKAIQWAQEQGISSVKIPAGTYAIASGGAHNTTGSQINLVSNMGLILDDHAVLQKEPNGQEMYTVIAIGNDVENVTIQGGTIRGDKDTHDYSKAEYAWLSGTHEWGTGISIKGAHNVTIDGVNISNFTGDAIDANGATAYSYTLSAKDFESGSFDDKGNPVADGSKIRSNNVKLTNFDNAVYRKLRTIGMWQPKGLASSNFDIYYYRQDGSFISRDTGVKMPRYESDIPPDAEYYRVVLDASSPAGVGVAPMTVNRSGNVTIRNCDLSFNRRQGISLVGVDNVSIVNNRIHDTKGTAPQSGLDAEGGFFLNSNLTVANNHFFNNANQDIVFSDGDRAVIDGNTLESRGLYIWPAFVDASVTNNTMNNSGMTLNGNAYASMNTVVNGTVNLNGPDVVFENGTLSNSSLSIGSASGTKAAHVTITSDGTNPKLNNLLFVGDQPVRLQDVTLKGNAQQGAILGTGNDATTYDHLVVNSDGTSLTRGSYSYASITAKAVSINRDGKYAFDHLTLATSGQGFQIHSTYGAPEVAIRDSAVTFAGNLQRGGLYVLGAKSLSVDNTTFKASNITGASAPIIKIGQFAAASSPSKIGAVAVTGSTIQADRPIVGIDTTDGGVGAPPYRFENNVLYNAALKLLPKDVNTGNNEETGP